MFLKILIILSLPAIIYLTTPKYYYGVVKYYNSEDGFGYIYDNETEDELYFYDENIIDDVDTSINVKYYKRNTRKGWEAYDIRVVK